MLNLTEIKRKMAPYMKSLGLVSTAGQRIWFDDNGFFLTVVNIEPLGNAGFFLNVTVKFMWTTPEVISYDYYSGDSRIYANDNPVTGAVCYDDPLLDEKIACIVDKAQKKITEYGRLREHGRYLKAIQSRNDFVRVANRGHEKMDVDLGIARFFDGDHQSAIDIFTVASEKSQIAKSFLEHCSSQVDFESFLIYYINENRRQFAAKWNINLPPIDILFKKNAKSSFFNFFKK